MGVDAGCAALFVALGELTGDCTFEGSWGDSHQTPSTVEACVCSATTINWPLSPSLLTAEVKLRLDKDRIQNVVIVLGIVLLGIHISFPLAIPYTWYRWTGRWFHEPLPKRPIQPFTLPRLDGGAVEVGATGRPTLLFFWGTHCPYCTNELRLLPDLARSFAGRVDVLTISDSRPEALSRKVERLRPKPVVLLDDGTIGTRFHVRTVPYNVMLDASGRIVERYDQAADGARLRAWLDEALE